MKQLKTARGRDITIYDDLFSYAEREVMHGFILNSLFTSSGRDSTRLEHQGDFNLCSQYSEQDVKNLGLLENPKLAKEITDRGLTTFRQARVNLSTLNDKNHFHTDSVDTVTLLYYPNLEWHIEWGGYTLFSDDSLRDIEHCVTYIPGRIVLFDGEIPHCIAAPTNVAPTYRFSFAIQFKKETK